MQPSTLSEKARKILQAIADGSTYDEIVNDGLAENDFQIFYAAAEALQLLSASSGSMAAAISSAKGTYHERLAEIQAERPKAYVPWTPEEDQQLTSLHHAGNSTKQIAHILQRQPGAIRSRLKKFGLI